MGKYQGYPEYQDSKVQWLPDLPQHWGIERVKRMLRLKRTLVGKKSSEYQLLSLTLKGIITRDISTGEGKIPESFDTYQEVEKNDLVFCLFDMDETPRTVGLSALNGMITGAYNVYGCLDKCYPAYASYYFLHIDKFKGLRPFYTGLRKVVRSETFNNIEIPCPPYEEQAQIANFLDHETAKIDTLIEKQQQLIKLLKEKRQAVISHAVTKGLPSANGEAQAPMKDSGVEWLGEVPEHWVVIPLKRAVRFQRGHDLPSQHRIEGNIPLVSSAGIIATHDKAVAKGPGLVTGRYGTIGDFTLVEEDYWPLNTTLYSIDLNGNMPKYLWYMLHNIKPIFIANSLKSAVPGVDRNDLHPTLVAMPKCIGEQEKIVEYLDKIGSIYHSLEKKADKQILLLKERRIALISAAVTGKIDVRGWIAPASQVHAIEETA